METKVILTIIVYLMLGILGSVVTLTGPITLLALLTIYLDRFKILKK